MDLPTLAPLALAALLVWTWRRVAASPLPATVANRAHRPSCAPRHTQVSERVTHPAHAGRDEIRTWVLRASRDCAIARAGLDGQRFGTSDAMPLPTLGCRSATCRCHYEPATEQRSSERREPERRSLTRLEARSDRRQRVDRRDGE
jgi:hypothetical protein